MSEVDIAESGRLARRTVITGALAATGGLVFAGTARAQGRRRAGLLDVSDPGVRARGHRIRVKVDNTKAGSRVDVEKAEPVALSLGSSRTDAAELTITSTTGRTTLSTGPAQARGDSSVTVRASKGSETVVFVTPKDYGPPSVPGDRLLVRGPDGEMTVDVWIEPTGGEWVPFGPQGNSLDLEICAVHAALMRKGTDGVEVVMFSPPRIRDDQGKPKRNPKWNPKHPDDTNQWLWEARALNDLESRAVDIQTVQVYDRVMKPRKYNIFCSGHAHMADGRLFLAGGHITEHGSNGQHMFRYDPSRGEEPAGGWTTIDVKMQQGRWYPVVVTLPDGRMLIAGGAYRSLLEGYAYWDTTNNNYEVIDPEQGVRLNDPAASPLIDVEAIKDKSRGGGPDARLSTYPGLYVLPGGNDDETVVALVETNRAWLYEYTPEKFLERKGSFYSMKTTGSRSYPHYGPMVLLPLAAEGKKARILALGGQHETTPLAEQRLLAPYQATTATAEVLDVDNETYLDKQPGWRSVGSMSQARFLCDATLLADGKVLVSGGSKQGWTDENTGWIYQSELFDPGSEAFAPAATATVDRRYHSVALLLPDGSVFKAGSTGGFAPDDLKAKKWFRARMNAERYLPPYFWRDDRPTIEKLNTAVVDGVSTVRHGEEFGIGTGGAGLQDAGVRVALIRFGSMTHGNNMDQRYVWLKASWQQPGTLATATVPGNPAAAPPGDYMLVVVDENDVPSQAKLVRVAA
jgi:hypothetical protein